MMARDYRTTPKAWQGLLTASRIHENSSEQDKGARENHPQRFLPYTLPQPEGRSDGDMERMERISSAQGTLLQGIAVLGMADTHPSASGTWSSRVQLAVVSAQTTSRCNCLNQEQVGTHSLEYSYSCQEWQDMAEWRTLVHTYSYPVAYIRGTRDYENHHVVPVERHTIQSRVPPPGLLHISLSQATFCSYPTF